MVGSGSGNEGGAGGPPDDGVVVASSRTGGSSSKQQRPLGRFGGASLDDASKGASIAVAYNSDTSISVIPRDEVAVASEYNEVSRGPARSTERHDIT